MIDPVLITANAQPAVTLPEAKHQLRITDSYEDRYVKSLISAATKLHEENTGRVVMHESWEEHTRVFHNCGMLLRKSPFFSLTSIKYTDTAAAEQTIASTVYTQHIFNTKARVYLDVDQEWPDDVETDKLNAIRILYVAGEAATTTAVPEDVKRKILMRVQELYDPEDKATRDAVERLDWLNKAN